MIDKSQWLYFNIYNIQIPNGPGNVKRVDTIDYPKLRTLTKSIEKYGLRKPIKLCRVDYTFDFILVDGFYRMIVFVSMLGERKVPAILLDDY